jgi:hypothetical protein
MLGTNPGAIRPAGRYGNNVPLGGILMFIGVDQQAICHAAQPGQKWVHARTQV